MLKFLESVRQSFLKEDMRVIKSDTGFLAYEKIFKQLMANHSDVVVWQVMPLDKSRQQTQMLIKTLYPETNSFYLQFKNKIDLSEQLLLYAYAPAVPMIFRTEILELHDSGVTLGVPSEITVFEDADVNLVKGLKESISSVWSSKRDSTYTENLGSDVMKVKSMAQRSTRDQELLNNEFGLTVDEEDKMFADKRESPRARPKDEKFVKIAKLQGNGPEVFKLFDLSRGGMGFITFDETEFTKGSDIHIVGFNDFDLDDPLVGKIMSIRPMDGTAEYKIGVKFSEGQD